MSHKVTSQNVSHSKLCSSLSALFGHQLAGRNSKSVTVRTIGALYSIEVDKGSELEVRCLQVTPITATAVLCLGHTVVLEKLEKTMPHLGSIV